MKTIDEILKEKKREGQIKEEQDRIYQRESKQREKRREAENYLLNKTKSYQFVQYITLYLLITAIPFYAAFGKPFDVPLRFGIMVLIIPPVYCIIRRIYLRQIRKTIKGPKCQT